MSQWVASREYIVTDESAGREWTISVAVGLPRPAEERDNLPIQNFSTRYVCPTQTGDEAAVRLVPGNDALTALFRAMLAIDWYLENLANRQFVITDINGKIYSHELDSLTQGPIGNRVAAKSILKELWEGGDDVDVME